jgi:hypothetical protein
MIKVTVKGVDKEIARLRKAANDVISARTLLAAGKLVNDLKEATPVDTGEARDGWHIEPSFIPGRVEIVNDVPHIVNLNNGSSQQAPAFFIEDTVLKQRDLRPEGQIVKITNTAE